jgi:hypothetical protein
LGERIVESQRHRGGSFIVPSWEVGCPTRGRVRDAEVGDSWKHRPIK